MFTGGDQDISIISESLQVECFEVDDDCNRATQLGNDLPVQ